MIGDNLKNLREVVLAQMTQQCGDRTVRTSRRARSSASRDSTDLSLSASRRTAPGSAGAQTMSHDAKGGGPSDEEERKLERAVDQVRTRREYWERTGELPLGRALGMMGRFGWTIVGPTLLGAFIGRWLDRNLSFRCLLERDSGIPRRDSGFLHGLEEDAHGMMHSRRLKLLVFLCHGCADRL